MEQIKIALSDIDDVKDFVSIVNQYPQKLSLLSGRYKMDAKSIMGIFSLDLSAPLTLEGDLAELIPMLQKYIIK